MLEFAGLPAHILLLHSVIVLAPIAGLGGILYALRPTWRRVLQWPVTILAVLVAGLTILTANAGEALEHALPGSRLIREHAEQGQLLEIAAEIFAAVVIVLFVLTWPRMASVVPFLDKVGAHRWLVLTVRIFAVLAGVFLIYQTVVTGHTGAQATWSDWRTG
ncbi:DUF2231 domain-containing protein [Dietzia sp. ANT_WB102]|uniref:DUF2231 domain-containing protein n=1 Tax=Dietzia sp. ANT_WB102 TaxID=2597345 RepID=UPI0011EED51E|nr:DUF2231 domain-containing protein [Dietzia sp. ANT_WB102]KAA0918174.1 hypothetical protein FQ137_01995 [Dietzia sp. ANT_WB102]